ncbi:unnamed protein product [Parajaminaea phylloscopi]
MAKGKKNLQTALAAHHATKAKKQHEEKVEEARKRKALSITSSKSGARKKRRLEAAAAASTAGSAGDGIKVSSTPTRRRMQKPFEPEDNVLLVGEGDFSFTLSLLSEPRCHDANRIVATSFDSYQDCIAKYPTAKDNIDKIRTIAQAAGREQPKLVAGWGSAADRDIVCFGVDAGDLLAQRSIRKWVDLTGGFNKVWFGFPHVGQGHKDESRNVLANQLLLLRFMVSAVGVLSTGAKPAYVTSQERNGGKGGKKSGEDDEKDDPQEDDPDEIEPDDDFSDEGDLQEMLSDDGEGDDDEKIVKQPSTHTPSWSPPRAAPRAGSLLITLREAKPYTLWTVNHLGNRLPAMLPGIAAAAPALPKGVRAPTLRDVEAAFPAPRVSGARKSQPPKGYDLWRSSAFQPSDWPGYKHVRTVGASRSGKGSNLLAVKGANDGGAFGTEGRDGFETDAACRTWEFGVRT